ncbi:hypothetical protein Bca52824_011709 [Brassica carinata]|uniref:Small RNA 2'-O-methyltransferase n=1 Tax=Brassica carinata TaxID=52824 RepID=A0A8X7VVK7_BRACI|nr:hypothetical protein Bca52824_011709 [Brassica carinata]
MAGGEKQTLTPKEIIHHKFGAKASYRTEEVHVSSSQDTCPGLTIPQKSHACIDATSSYQTFLLYQMSSRRRMMLSNPLLNWLWRRYLGIQPHDDDNITVEQAWNDIVERIKYIFSDEFLSADHPLGSHLGARLQRDGERSGSLPVSVISTFDAKIIGLCKVINPSVDSDPILAMSYVMKAAAKLPDYIVISPHVASLRRKNPYPPKIRKAVATHVESISFKAVYIRCTTGGEEVVEPVTLDISPDQYYLDVIAKKLGLKDGGLVMISRWTIGEASSGHECIVYSAIPKLKASDNSWKAHGKRPVAESSHLEKTQNGKASLVCGLDTHGDAIVASVGYTGRSHDLKHDDVTLKSFYRICTGVSPNGIYKLSREALIAAQLPFSFTAKSTWRGPLPREILSMFCRQQQLAEPVFTISTAPVRPLSEILRTFKKLQDSESDETNNQYMSRGNEDSGWDDNSNMSWEDEDSGSDDTYDQYISWKDENSGFENTNKQYRKEKDSGWDDSNNQYMSWGEEDSRSEDTNKQCRSSGKEEVPVSWTETETGYRCEVKILSKSHDLVLECTPGSFYEKENYAIQNASLKALSWFSCFFDDLDADPEQPRYTNEDLNWLFQRSIMIKGTRRHEHPLSKPRTMDMLRKPKRVQTIANGSLVTICYSVSVEVDADFSRNGKCLKGLIESNKEIEFEVGNGSMNPHLESVVTQMSVGQYACFVTNLPAEGLVLAAATDTVRTHSLLSELSKGLEYSVQLLGVKGPTEKRMEADLFKPPLSKQRVEFAVKRMKESSASTLVDFGCRSGSLLESLLDYPTSLHTIIGVDISQKGLTRAAKMLHSKVNKGACNLKSITLYDGSILEFDSRLHDIDICTCLEVIEHMEEDQTFQFGKTVLSLFRPKLLIVSTPNYEYNTVLQQSGAPCQPKDKTESQLPKFRNHDHKFEWTRAQFSQWASKLAKRYNYSVEFTGVGGGSGNVDPGFASQIAVFKRQSFSEVNVDKKVEGGSMHPYKAIWEWKKSKWTEL